MSRAIAPRYYELEAFRKSVSLRLWLGMGFLFVAAVLSLGLALIAFARPIPVVVLDKSGRALLFKDTFSARHEMSDVRIEYFVEKFVRAYVGIDSANVAADLEDSLNMMTPVFRQVVAADTDDLARRKKYEGQNIQTSIGDWKVRIGKYDAADTKQRIHVLVTARMGFEPRFGQVEGEGKVERWFLSQIVLERVPVTKLSIHGLLVAYCDTRFFDEKADLDHYLGERAARP